MSDQDRVERKLRLESQYANGASWFYWIAGLSIINTVVGLFNGSMSFISGLGITQIIDGISYALKDGYGNGIVYFGVGIDVVIILVFAVLGILSHRGKNWAMIVGAILYSLDTLTFLIVTDYLSIGFHILAVYSIIKGIQAGNKLRSYEQIEQIAFADDEIIITGNISE
jgi:hypothetical protein